MNALSNLAAAVAHRFSWQWIVFAGVLAHGVVPLTSYCVWDSWTWASDLVRPEGPAVLSRLFRETGRPLDMAFYLPLQSLQGNPVAWAKLLGTGVWIASAACMTSVVRRAAALPRDVAVAIGVLAVTSPAFDLLGELALWMNTAAVLLFWLAWLMITWLPNVTGVAHAGLRIIALATFFLSFNLNSNLVMFYGVAAAMTGIRLSNESWQQRFLRAVSLARRHADFLALPILFWIWKTIFTPTSGYYASGYNEPSLEMTRLVAGYVILLRYLLVGGLLDLFASPAWVGVSIGSGAVAGYLVARYPSGDNAPSASSISGGLLAVWGAVLLCAAAFPYIVVGQPLTNEGWWTRNCILCSLPLAMIACGLALVANARWAPGRPRAWLALVVVLAALGIGGTTRNYLAYQALGTKQDAAHAILHSLAKQTDACAIQVRDYVSIPHTIDFYPPIVWTFITSGTGDRPTAFVFDASPLAPDQVTTAPDGTTTRLPPLLSLNSEMLAESIKETTLPYALEGIPLQGPQVIVTLEPAAPIPSATVLGLTDLVLSWIAPAKRQSLVAELLKAVTYSLPPVK